MNQVTNIAERPQPPVNPQVAAVAVQSRGGALALSEDELLTVLRSSLYPGATDPSIKMVIAYCKAAGLDPMLKPVHIVPMYVKNPGGNGGGMRDVIMPGIAHYRTQASRTGRYLGKSEPVFGPMITEELGGLKVTYPEWCTATVKVAVGNHIAEFTATEFWIENYATAGRETLKPNAMWQKRPRGQLAKVAEAQALRQAFPELIGGTNTAEEMEGKTIEAEYTEISAQDQSQKPRGAAAALDGFAGKNGTQGQQPTTGAQKPRQSRTQAAQQPPREEPRKERPAAQEQARPTSDGGYEVDAAGVPQMPQAVADSWSSDGKWAPAWRWLKPILADVSLEGEIRQQLIDEHASVLRAVRAYSEAYAEQVDALLQREGLVLAD